MQKIQVGGHVKFFNEHGKEVDALVTAVWGDPEGTPGINLTFVSLNDEKSDSYGRQIERHSSVVHGDQQSAHGMYWTRSTE